MTLSKENLETAPTGGDREKMSKKSPEISESNTAELKGILDKAQQAKRILEKNPKALKEAQGLLVQIILELYRLPMVRRAEVVWNNRSDRSKNFLLGEGFLGKIGNTNPAVGAVQTLTVILVDAGLLEPPTGMDLDKAGERSVMLMNTLDKTSPVWSQILLLFGPEAEAAVPIVVEIVKTMAFLNKNYQTVMKESRTVVGKERADVQKSLDTAEKLHAEPTSFVLGETHGSIEEDLGAA